MVYFMSVAVRGKAARAVAPLNVSPEIERIIFSNRTVKLELCVWIILLSLVITLLGLSS